ncbi:MAG: DUF4026 domain-containing protein [Oscillospiraceae bacterium]
MGILDKFKKKPAENIPPRSGTIEKTPSYIMLIPKDDSLLNDLEPLMNKLLALPYIKVISKKITEGFELVLEYKGAEYKFCVSVESFELPALFRIGHDFTDSEIQVMETAKRGLASSMVFSANNCESFHLQIKLLCEMIGEPAGIVDFSGERMLAGRWAKLAAASEVPPSPEYLYVIQCVSGDDNCVWMHTHGLNRCGGQELEILNSDKDNYPNQACILTTLAGRIVSENGFADEYEPVFTIRLAEGIPLVATWVRWETAIKAYSPKFLGGTEDRKDGHNENTGVVFLYRNKNDCDKRVLSHVSIYNELLSQNPMLMITSEETERMRRLALERLGYMIGLFESRDRFEKIAVLVKVGLEVDEEYRDGDMKEHIWFEMKDVNTDEGSFTAELTQEPYYVAALKAGDIRSCRFDEITDWTVLIDGDRITPDSVYRLEK